MKQLMYILVACCLCMTGCRQEESLEGIAFGDDLQLNMQTDGLLDQYTVTTRGTDTKTPEEQEIKTLHVFIFDKDGNYLETADKHRYQGYRSITGGKTVMNIDREGWKDNEKAEHATVIVVANVETGTFRTETADTPPTNVKGRDELLSFHYKPLSSRYITQLPESGMPMFGRVDDINLTRSNKDNSINIPMKALMSRIDISLQIDGNNTDVTGTLPQLTVTECKVLNVPKATVFAEDLEKETNLSELEKDDYKLPQTSIQTIQNKKGKLEYTFYTFENLQNLLDEWTPVTNPEDGTVINWKNSEGLLYPDGIKDEEKQQYKPELADKNNSLAFQFQGHYITYNGASYEATYTLYLGADHTDDFKVMRNKQYKNDVTIKGIVKAGNNPEHITFDTRVNISSSNPYFVSILKDRKLDSHFNVIPMDIYFFNTNPSNPNPPQQSMKVKILDSDEVTWVRMERIPAVNMQYGTVPDVADDGPSLLAVPDEAGTWNTAGNGKRKYFTTDLVTHTLKNNTEITLDTHRDRIYFYVDENIEVWNLGDDPTKRTRTATVQLTYYEGGIEKGTRQLILEQAKLLEVTFHGPKNDGSNDPKDETDGMTDKIIYIEAYEEYLDHSDPLDEYESNQVYSGLPWEDYDGGSGTIIGLKDIEEGIGITLKKCSNNFYWGYEFTRIIANEVESEKGSEWWGGTTYSYANITLNSKPKTAAGYCFLKNKRNQNGNIDNPKWYLPGIRELERLLEDYYIEYPEFQNNYYWSSAAGEGDGGIDDENANYARATKAYIGTDGTFHYYNSGTGNIYTGENGNGGFTPRKNILRIRAARIDANPQ